MEDSGRFADRRGGPGRALVPEHPGIPRLAKLAGPCWRTSLARSAAAFVDQPYMRSRAWCRSLGKRRCRHCANHQPSDLIGGDPLLVVAVEDTGSSGQRC
jgi:hypothetical protein